MALPARGKRKRDDHPQLLLPARVQPPPRRLQACMRVHLPKSPASPRLRAFSYAACAAIEHVYAVHGMRRRLRALCVRWNMRFTSTAGRAYYGRNEIHLSGPLWPHATEAQRRDVAAHEAAHLVAFHAHHHMGHGQPWRDVMRRAGFEPQRQHDIAAGVRVSCACAGGRLLTPVRHGRLLRGSSYRCLACGHAIRPLDRPGSAAPRGAHTPHGARACAHAPAGPRLHPRA